METEQDQIDALDPQSSRITVKGIAYTVNPPSLASYLRLQRVVEKISRLDTLTDDEIDQMEQSAISAIQRCAPDLSSDSLNVKNILEITMLILQLGTPQAANEELKSRGITVDEPKKAD